MHFDWMESATLDDFVEAYQTAGATWQWVDAYSRTYYVMFRSLVPAPIRGHDAHTVDIVFDVLQEITP